MSAAAMCLVASMAAAQFPPITDPNKDEVKCESGTGKALTKFIGAKAKCGAKCIATARKTSGPYGPCNAPYTDPVTQACVYDPVKGARVKAEGAIIKACAVDCPECYTAQDANLCTTGNPLVANSDTQTNAFGPLIYCIENGGNTPTKEQAKCEDGTSKALVKFIGLKSKCYQKCSQNMIKGKIAAGSCDPPTPTDPATSACIFDPLKGAEAKSAAAIDKVCANVVGATPGCYGTGLDTGQEWVTTVEGAIDTSIPNIACGQLSVPCAHTKTTGRPAMPGAPCSVRRIDRRPQGPTRSNSSTCWNVGRFVVGNRFGSRPGMKPVVDASFFQRCGSAWLCCVVSVSAVSWIACHNEAAHSAIAPLPQ
jgi:hypothetical protein